MSVLDDDVMSTLIGPVTWEQFAARWHEKSPLHVQRDDRQHFAWLADIGSIEQLLSVQSMTFPELQLSRAADPVPPGAYTDANERILPVRLLEHHANGATIVLSHAARRLPALAALCRRLEAKIGAGCQANLYLSPPGQQGFAPHYDAHDVFILQVAGAKRFAFYEGGPALPLADDRFDPSSTPAGARSLDLLLESGSTLYIPRGVMHDAVSHEQTPSLHVTIGTYAPSTVDVLHRALDHAAARDIRLRQAVSTDTVPDAAALRTALENAFDDPGLRAAASALVDDAALKAMPDVVGLSARLRRAHALGDATRLQARVGTIWGVERRDGVLRVRCAGALLECRGDFADAVWALIDAGTLRVGALPADSAAGRHALAQRLVAENLADPVTP